MLVQMIKTSHGAPYGKVVEEYLEGQEYEVVDGLAKVFVGEGWAKQVIIAIITENSQMPIARKMGQGPEENKAIKETVTPYKETVINKTQRRSSSRLVGK